MMPNKNEARRGNIIGWLPLS